MPRKRVTIHTDGSCETQTGEGGWAFLLSFGDVRRRVSGFESGTTNNRMELTAAVRALEALNEPCHVELVTDSQYLKKAFSDDWLGKWQRNGWRTASKQPVKNKDLWLKLLELTAVHQVDWRWTRGHAGQESNEAVDTLALAARRNKRGVDETYRVEGSPAGVAKATGDRGS